MKTNEEAGEAQDQQEPPCSECRWWDPKVLSDSCGIIRGVCYCSKGHRRESSCFERPPRKEDENR